jgi:hypothetical protein
MIKKASILVLIICLFLSILSPTLVQSQSGLTILANSAQVEFPSKLSFNLSAEGDVNITDIRLCYTVDRASFAQVTSEVYIEFVPATVVDVNWTLEMIKIGGLPPGSSVDYWWTIEDASGSKIETAPSRIQFDDNRYSWRSLTGGEVTIYWYKGNDSFAREIMLSAQQALARLAEDTGAELEQPVKLYIYANAQDLQGAMIYPQEWTGGVAFTRYGIIAIGIAPHDLSWGKRAIAHELTHIRNRDVRLLIISIVFVGIFAFISEALFRSLRFRGLSRGKKGSGAAILIAIVLALVGYLIASLFRFALSRKREYLADAGSAELTRNPLALASALRKISADPTIEAVQRKDVAQMFIENPQAALDKSSFSIGSLFATHPPIKKRIEILEQF